MSLFWAIPLTLLVVGAGISLCFWLLHKSREVDSSVWILEQIACPIIRILVLLAIVSLVYPAIFSQSTSDFWRVMGHREQFNDLLNILFLAGLALSFIPLLSHPVIALPVQSILTIALLFSWQFADTAGPLTLVPSLILMSKIFGYMLLAYLVTRESSILVSRWVDRRFALDGSIRLVSDAIYLVLQIPVILLYGNFLKSQLG